MTTELAQLDDLWAEAEGHMQAVVTYARRTAMAAWLAGDALLRIKSQLPHGHWTPALQKRGIAPRTARRFIALRQKYDQIGQVGRFASVSAALSGPVETVEEPVEAPAPRYVFDAADIWDWERNRLSPIAVKLLPTEDPDEVEVAMHKAIVSFADIQGGIALFRQALACFVDVGPLEGDEDAMRETERRLAALFINKE